MIHFIKEIDDDIIMSCLAWHVYKIICDHGHDLIIV
jgi:hypothetical protein